MMGEVGILNVGAGDTKLSFDPSNPAERIRAARIVKDMIRRGYALLVETGAGPDGKPIYQRAYDFDEARAEYIIADLDPEIAADADRRESREETPPAKEAGKKRGRPAKTRRLDAGKARSAVAVAPTAGG